MITLIVLTSCASQDKEITEEVVVNPEKYENNAISNIAKEQAEVELEIEEVQESYDEAVKGLIDKGKDINNYKYTFGSTAINQFGSYIQSESFTVFVKESKMKKVYNSPIKYGSNKYYNEVYLEEGKAIAICSERTVECDELYNKAFSVTDEKVSLLPTELLLQVPFTAKVVGEELIDQRREATILEYLNEKGQLERLSVGQYYGLPLKQAIYKMVDDEQTLVEKNNFNIISVGNVKNADVNLAESYEII